MKISVKTEQCSYLPFSKPQIQTFNLYLLRMFLEKKLPSLLLSRSTYSEADVSSLFHSVMQNEFPKLLASHHSLSSFYYLPIAPAVTAELCKMFFKILSALVIF